MKKLTFQENSCSVVQHAEENYQHYNTPSVVADYDRDKSLCPAEEFLFGSYIKPSDAILDIGVGAGRTSLHLARNASCYVGIDYAPEMLKICRNKYPQLEFQEMSATDLSSFQDETFGAVVISANCIDDLPSAEDRRRCLLECWRVLRANGVLIFSSRTPRAIRAVHTPRLTERYRLDHIPYPPGTLSFHIRRIRNFIIPPVVLTKLTLERMYLYMRKPAFWKGEGYMLDPSKLLKHYAIPRKVIAEMSQYGWQFLATLSGDYPRRTRPLATYFHYYAFRKPA